MIASSDASAIQAPESDTKRTLGGTSRRRRFELSASTTIISVSLWLITLSTSTPLISIVSSADPPRRRLVPEMVTTVPTCPVDGATLIMLPAFEYSHPSVRVTVAPELDKRTTSPVCAVLAAALTLTVVSSSSRSSASTPARVT